MKVGKALRHVMKAGNISIYRLAIQAEMDRGGLGKIVKGNPGATWDVVERIATGLSKIDPMWKGAFLYTLSLPNDAFPDDTTQVPEMSTEDAVKLLEESQKRGEVNLPPGLTAPQQIRFVQKFGVNVTGELNYRQTGLSGISEKGDVYESDFGDEVELNFEPDEDPFMYQQPSPVNSSEVAKNTRKTKKQRLESTGKTET